MDQPGETEQEFMARIELRLAEAVKSNPGVSVDMLRKQLILVERVGRVDPSKLALQAVDTCLQHAPAIENLETGPQKLREIASILHFSVTLLAERLRLLDEETKGRIFVAGNALVN